MYKQFSFQGKHKYIDILPKIVDEYNHKYHRIIKCTLAEVNEDNENEILQNIIQSTDPRKQPLYRNQNLSKPKFKVGDKVRISNQKTVFEKGYTPNWTSEIFTVSEIQTNTRPVTYLLTDHSGSEIKGSFYAEELAKTNYPDVYLVEKVLKTRGDRVFVKWWGFENKWNSWIPKKDIVS